MMKLPDGKKRRCKLKDTLFVPDLSYKYPRLGK